VRTATAIDVRAKEPLLRLFIIYPLFRIGPTA
jgi:hypothetical protein